MPQQERFLALLDKYTSGNIEPEEYNELFLLISSGGYDDLIEEHFKSNFEKGHIPGVGLQPHRAQELMHQILSTEKRTSHILPRIFRKRKFIRLSAAACISGVIIVAAYLFFNLPGNHNPNPLTGRQDKKIIKEVNRLDHATKVRMEDGSLVTLQPGSTLEYPSRFQVDKREVYLEGEAFFQVSENPSRPFRVYHSNLITQVLGTSFIVKSDKQKRLAEVSVITGKVQVYENNETTTGRGQGNTGVILTPNQKVLYKEEHRQFMATLVNDPKPVINDSANSKKPESIFHFEETPLHTVFATLEKYYGIEILVENDHIYE